MPTSLPRRSSRSRTGWPSTPRATPGSRGAHRRRVCRLRQRPPRPRQDRGRASSKAASSPTGTASMTVVDDLYAVTRTIRAEQPGLPIFLFGHSMGSMLSRTYAIRTRRRARRTHPLRHRRRPRDARQGGPGRRRRRGQGAWQGHAEPAARQDVVRQLQQALRAGPHSVRLAVPRPGRGRRLHRRPVVRIRLHGRLVPGLLRGIAVDQRRQPGRAGPTGTCRSTSSPVPRTRSATRPRVSSRWSTSSAGWASVTSSCTVLPRRPA
jgi:pimeloyl-ACP methyl ester carboxylesterase